MKSKTAHAFVLLEVVVYLGLATPFFLLLHGSVYAMMQHMHGIGRSVRGMLQQSVVDQQLSADLCSASKNMTSWDFATMCWTMHCVGQDGVMQHTQVRWSVTNNGLLRRSTRTYDPQRAVWSAWFGCTVAQGCSELIIKPLVDQKQVQAAQYRCSFDHFPIFGSHSYSKARAQAKYVLQRTIQLYNA